MATVEELSTEMSITGFSLFSILVVMMLPRSSSSGAADIRAVNPCCYYPCQNRGVCVRFGTDSYDCDCTNTGFYGENCTTPEFWTQIRMMLKPSPAAVHFLLTHFQWFWSIVNNSFLRDTFMRIVLTVRNELIPSPPTYNTKYGYISWESYYNLSYYTRLLPPVPEDCPLPMGTKGKPVLPDAKEVSERFLKRREFRPDPQGTNLMFAFMAQHFTHQFFKGHKVEAGFTKALGHGVDASNIYGEELERQHQLRLHKDGKLRYQMINGEMYPPSVSEVPVHMVYPEGFPPEQRLAIGQEVFGLIPGLTLYATIWLREHNRVCDILKGEHPTWDDEQLFQTTRLIIIGEIINIIIEEYVQHLSGYYLKLKYDPSLLFRERFQYTNRIALEFSLLYHWHPLMPDSFLIDGDEIPYSQFLYNTSIMMHYGVEKLVDAFSRQPAGQIGGGRNIHQVVLRVAEKVITDSRTARLQPFNQYRKRFNLKPYSSFYELTGDEEIAKGLEELYGDIDALEFYPALLLEKTRPNSIFGESMVEMGAPFSLKGLLGNPINSPEYWKPSTFGGQTGFNIIKTSTLKKLVCLNTKWCPYVDFHIPRNEEEAKSRKPSTEL
ncbi:PREDICTED: prostaglandin G/H synthase 1-like isoform X1 [Cyprinodon variegatus]|uniref:Prostaglandin G/H synthase 1 n=2 Tax=Cyprinodon variegatus TaxID=28743 RepID=A0A3Q2DHK3_CYPVA|nr:PREDICTED: prostaglandin G/H synthase 1-like isoform X1 [Cyprinodon variegatus]